MIASGQQGPTIALIDEEFPWPTNSGKRLRTMNLVQRLAGSHRLIYVAHRNACATELSQARQHLESLGVETLEVPRRIQPKSGPAFYARLAGNLRSPLPYSVSSHYSDEMRDRLEQLNRERSIDLWHCEWTPYVELFRHLEFQPLVVAAHNVESQIWDRYAAEESNPLKRWYIRLQHRKFEQFERWAFQRAGQIIAVSDDDARLARQQFGANQVEVVQNGVDLQRYRHNDQPRRQYEMIFLGSLDWRPNLHGMQTFLKTTLPKIAHQEPRARLTIVGRNPPAWLRQRAERDDRIELHANVDDVVPWLSRAGLMIVPLQIGGGSRLKIIESAANRLPVVSTTVGAEGLQFVPDRDYLSADSIDAMDRPVIEAMHYPETARQIADNAYRIVQRVYDWDGLARQQAEIWATAVNPSRDPRSASA